MRILQQIESIRLSRIIMQFNERNIHVMPEEEGLHQYEHSATLVFQRIDPNGKVIGEYSKGIVFERTTEALPEGDSLGLYWKYKDQIAAEVTAAHLADAGNVVEVVVKEPTAIVAEEEVLK